MILKNTITFVSAFIDLNEDRSKDKSPEFCFLLFDKLVKLDINICVFVSSKYYDIATIRYAKNKNIHIMPSIELSDLWTYKITASIPDISLPIIRTHYHDTFNFLILMNSKIEFVNKAIEKNPFNTTHFAWIDFSICHVIKSENSLVRLSTYSKSLLKNTMLVFPGCWSNEQLHHYKNTINDRVIWRYCGGFFIGDKISLLKFNECFRMYYPSFLYKEKKLVWEVNFWGWLEIQNYFSPHVYMANHDDSIIQIPSNYLQIVACLTTIPSRIERCKKTIRSLINQVDHIYLSASTHYERFGEAKLPNFDQDLDIVNHVTIIESADYGPATKYLGALSIIPDSCWIFICDDDQEYRPDLIKRMTNNILSLGAYQNRYSIVKNGSGGIIHGYVGNMFHKELLNELKNFDLPKCARYVDDQWMSIYCFLHNINIYPTSIELYSDIFSVLLNGYEQIGEDSLASLHNRDVKVAELADYFKVVFKEQGMIENK